MRPSAISMTSTRIHLIPVRRRARIDLDCTRLALSVARPANGPLFSGKGRAIGLRPPSRITPSARSGSTLNLYISEETYERSGEIALKQAGVAARSRDPGRHLSLVPALQVSASEILTSAVEFANLARRAHRLSLRRVCLAVSNQNFW